MKRDTLYCHAGSGRVDRGDGWEHYEGRPDIPECIKSQIKVPRPPSVAPKRYKMPSLTQDGDCSHAIVGNRYGRKTSCGGRYATISETGKKIVSWLTAKKAKEIALELGQVAVKIIDNETVEVIENGC